MSMELPDRGGHMKSHVLVLIGIAFVLAGCGQAPLKEYPETTTADARRLTSEIATGAAQHLDVLAPEEFVQAKKLSEKVDAAIIDGDDENEILSIIAQSRAVLKSAYTIGKSRRPAVDGIIRIRQMAMEAGVRNYPKFGSDLNHVDDDLRDQVHHLDDLSLKDFSKIQGKYMDLELATLKANNLDHIIKAIETAKDEHKAKKVAPKSLKTAEFDLQNAENMIAASRGRPETYRASVEKARYSSQLLTDVIMVATKGENRLDEDTALNIVYQNRRISSLQTNLTAANTKNKTLDQKMTVANATYKLQKSIEAARHSFTKQEAEVYQQGDRVLIRLKAMNFSSGHAELPASSFTLLNRVKKVAIDLGFQHMIIEGHTDSAGKSESNDQLSQSRAEAVAHYFESNGVDGDKIQAVGFGFKKPIASNKTSIGRSQNRRVDIIITPNGAQRETASEK